MSVHSADASPLNTSVDRPVAQGRWGEGTHSYTSRSGPLDLLLLLLTSPSVSWHCGPAGLAGWLVPPYPASHLLHMMVYVKSVCPSGALGFFDAQGGRHHHYLFILHYHPAPRVCRTRLPHAVVRCDCYMIICCSMRLFPDCCMIICCSIRLFPVRSLLWSFYDRIKSVMFVLLSRPGFQMIVCLWRCKDVRVSHRHQPSMNQLWKERRRNSSCLTKLLGVPIAAWWLP